MFSRGKGQKELIHSSDWDLLVILDACRYDYFKNIYGKYLEGDLEKAVTPASHTLPWCRKVFSERYENIVYVSANPFINSRMEVGGFNASNHFHKVIDVWEWGWSKKHGTVHPAEVKKGMWKALQAYPGKRIVAHYIQPHGPYLGLDVGKTAGLHNVPQQIDNNSLKDLIGRSLSWMEKRFLFPHQLLKWIYQLRMTAGIEIGPVRRVFARRGLKVLRGAYQRNLELVLKSVSRLLRQGISDKKRVVITADHGELLGDGGFSHPPGLRHPSLTEVPWFRVRGAKTVEDSPISEKTGEREIIFWKIRDLREREKV